MAAPHVQARSRNRFPERKHQTCGVHPADEHGIDLSTKDCNVKQACGFIGLGAPVVWKRQ